MTKAFIQFFSEDTTFTLRSKTILRTWIQQIINKEKYKLQSLNYIFCSDEYLLSMNEEYLNHDTYTDILTFDNSSLPNEVEGDIFISIDRIKDNANKMNLSFEQELHRVVIHGVLHLMDYKDRTAQEKSTMREKEDACLSLLQL